VSDLIPYASMTGTRRNLAALRARGWRVLLSPVNKGTSPQDFKYALDNGAWSYYQQGVAFDEKAFVKILERRGAHADWVVVPDIVQGGRASWDLTLRWLPRVLDHASRALLAVQDGFDEREVEALIGPRVGIFVGGSTGWKLATTHTWARVGRARDAWVHVGRVNTARRIALCADAGVSSFDGTSATRYSKTLSLLDAAVRQQTLNWQED